MIMSKAPRFAAALLVGTMCLFSCNGEEEPPFPNNPPAKPHSPGFPNVVMISLDTVRADHCSVYGYPKPTTPNLVRLAEEGVVFDAAYAPTGITGPSHSTLFTGQYVIFHGVVKNGLRLQDGSVTLAERLREAGYDTAGFVSSFPLDHRFGYAQGFDAFDDDFAFGKHTIDLRNWEGYALERPFDRRGDFTTRRALRWLETRRDEKKPFFLFVHYFDPHSPYLPLPESREKIPLDSESNSLERLLQQYDSEIAFADRQIGLLLDALEAASLSEDTLVVVVADHGEGLMQRGYLQHAANINEEEVRVPMLMRWVGRIPRGSRIGAPVSLMDVAPTVLDAGGIGYREEEIQGRSLFRVLTGHQEPNPERPIHLFRRQYPYGTLYAGWNGLQPDGQPYPPVPVAGEEYGLREGPWKYIIGPQERKRELFDLDADPRELTNLADEHPERVQAMHRDLETWVATYRRPPAPDARNEVDREALEALGYVQ
jgi:arylsulfatase A-like enzyme